MAIGDRLKRLVGRGEASAPAGLPPERARHKATLEDARLRSTRVRVEHTGGRTMQPPDITEPLPAGVHVGYVFAVGDDRVSLFAIPCDGEVPDTEPMTAINLRNVTSVEPDQ